MNMKKRCFPGAIILLVGVLASCGGGDKQQAASPSSAALQSADTSVPRVPALEEQFASIDADGGYPLTFRYWNNEAGGFIGDDPTLCAHYQGINRVQGYDGTSYLYLTRNGNPIFICSWTYDDYPGEILIVEMGDRTSTGEVFSEDFTGEPLGYGLAQPLAEDHTVRSIHLNGIDLGSGVDWKHPGSGQQVGDYLFIPVEKTCNYDADEEKCGGDEDPRGAILVLQVSDPMDPGLTPADPERLCQLEYFQYEGRDDAYKTLPMIGTLAATKKDGKYLFAHTTGGGYHKETALTFYEIEDENLCSRQNFTSPFIKRVDIWNADELKDNVGEDKWHGVENSSYFLDWQMINFLQDQGDSLFLLGTDKSGDGAAISSDDYARLFKVERSGNQFSVRYVAEKHFELKKAFWMGQEWDVQIGNFDAVGGVYVSPAGRLIMYSGTHDNDWPPFIFGTLPDNLGVCDGDSRCDGYPMGEFAANHFHPPELTVPDEAEADEGTPTFFDGCSFTDALTAGQSWEATVTWGDGSTDTIQATPDAPMPLEHGYEEGPSVHTVTVTVADSDGFTGTGSFDVTVSNVPPTVVIEAVTDEGGGILGVDIPFTLPGRELTLSGSYTDPGATDTHTGTVIWGDGTMTDLGAVSGPVHVPYTYNLPGFYTITFTVTDDDGGSGEASEAVTVLSVVDGLREIVEMLRPHAGNYRVRRAIADLEGNKGGQASNGAIDLLEKGNTNAALVHIGHAIRELTDAQAHDPGLDLEAPLYLLNMTIEELAGG
jgi:hypothetical protein